MSRVEGGANVVIEALRSGTPVLASRIAGNLGLLGDDHLGFFEVGDAGDLAQAMRRFFGDPAFAAQLLQHGKSLSPRFAPEREADALRHLLRELIEPRQG
jgi:glycosyltransferase involved in cell wall biosynthesis